MRKQVHSGCTVQLGHGRKQLFCQRWGLNWKHRCVYQTMAAVSITSTEASERARAALRTCNADDMCAAGATLPKSGPFSGTVFGTVFCSRNPNSLHGVWQSEFTTWSYGEHRKHLVQDSLSSCWTPEIEHGGTIEMGTGVRLVV